MHYVSTRDVHDREFKIRLTEADEALVRALSQRLGIPPAVLIRSWVKRELSGVDRRTIAISGLDSRA